MWVSIRARFDVLPRVAAGTIRRSQSLAVPPPPHSSLRRLFGTASGGSGDATVRPLSATIVRPIHPASSRSPASKPQPKQSAAATATAAADSTAAVEADRPVAVTFHVRASDADMRLDRFLVHSFAANPKLTARIASAHPNSGGVLPRSMLQKWFRKRAIIMYQPNTTATATAATGTSAGAGAGATNASAAAGGVEKVRGVLEGATRVRAGQSLVIPGHVLRQLFAPAPGANAGSADEPRARAASGRLLRARKQPRVELSEPEIAKLRASVLYKDEHILAINKPSGLAVQGGTSTSTHVDGMCEYLKYEYDTPPRLVHRLDKHCSGVLLLARTTLAAQALSLMFRKLDQFKFEKKYWAVTVGTPPPALDRMTEGRIDVPLQKLAVNGGSGSGSGAESVQLSSQFGSQLAVTLFSTIARHPSAPYRWLEMQPLTGRKHQLRAHSALVLHTPILGDDKYPAKPQIAAATRDGETPVLLRSKHLHLHARSLTFRHPIFRSAPTLHIEAPPPPHFIHTACALGWDMNALTAAHAASSNTAAATAAAANKQPRNARQT